MEGDFVIFESWQDRSKVFLRRGSEAYLARCLGGSSRLAGGLRQFHRGWTLTAAVKGDADISAPT